MAWILDNWIWILLGGGFVVMHLFGHGGHGKTAGAAPASQPGSEPDSKKIKNSGDPS